MKRKIIVAGLRTFIDYEILKQKLDELAVNTDNAEIVCREARGADTLGKKYAIENGLEVKSFPAKWSIYGRKAGMIRNKQMAEYANEVVVFWDGESKGTKNMIELANNYNLILTIVDINSPEQTK